MARVRNDDHAESWVAFMDKTLGEVGCDWREEFADMGRRVGGRPGRPCRMSIDFHCDGGEVHRIVMHVEGWRVAAVESFDLDGEDATEAWADYLIADALGAATTFMESGPNDPTA